MNYFVSHMVNLIPFSVRGVKTVDCLSERDAKEQNTAVKTAVVIICPILCAGCKRRAVRFQHDPQKQKHSKQRSKPAWRTWCGPRIVFGFPLRAASFFREFFMSDLR